MNLLLLLPSVVALVVVASRLFNVVNMSRFSRDASPGVIGVNGIRPELIRA